MPEPKAGGAPGELKPDTANAWDSIATIVRLMAHNVAYHAACPDAD